MKNKAVVIIVVVVLVIGLIGGGAFVAMQYFGDPGSEVEEDNESFTIEDLTVSVIYNQEEYIVEGALEKVNVKISGSKKKIKQAKEELINVRLDLSDVKPDKETKVKFECSGDIKGVTYVVEPSFATVTLKKKVSSLSRLSYELINEDKIKDMFSVQKVSLNKNEVVIKGSESDTSKVDKVKALIDLEKIEVSGSGTYYANDLELVAYDKKGNKIDNVEIVATETYAQLLIKAVYSKEVPISVIIQGDLVSGKAIKNISINDRNEYYIKIYGNEEDLEDIWSIPVTVDVSGLGNDSSKKYDITLLKPANVVKMSESKCNVTLTFGVARQKTVTVSSIQAENIGDGLGVNLLSDDDFEVTVQVIGYPSVIEDIDEYDLTAYVDLEGYGTGKYTVDVKVKTYDNDPRIKFVVSKKVNVYIFD